MSNVQPVVEVVSHPIYSNLTAAVHKPPVRLKRQNFTGV